jgi:hypothetical protein
MRLFRVFPVMGLVVAALAVPAAAAAAPTVAVAPSAQLGPEGASAIVTLTASCDSGTTAFGNATLSQSTGNRLVQGFAMMFGSPLLVCDGTPRAVPATMSVSNAPLKSGKAVVTATISEFDPLTFGFAGATATGEVQLKK